jgi:hypothetical protein
LKQPTAGTEFSLDMVQFKPNTSDLEPSSEPELKRFVRMAKANPELSFEIQVMLNGYHEDSIQSSPDLTELTMDSIQVQVDDIDTLGQVFKRDTIIVKSRYHNNRTQPQALAIVEYLTRLGVGNQNLIVFTNAIPAVLPENKKLIVKIVVRPKKTQ